MVDPSFRVTPVDGRTLQLAGELDIASAPVLQAALSTLRPDGQVSLDLGELTFLDSSGLNTFAQYGKELDGQGPLVLANVPDPIAYLLDLVGFDELATIEIRR
jgi:anti-anti-sigma factor